MFSRFTDPRGCQLLAVPFSWTFFSVVIVKNNSVSQKLSVKFAWGLGSNFLNCVKVLSWRWVLVSVGSGGMHHAWIECTGRSPRVLWEFGLGYAFFRCLRSLEFVLILVGGVLVFAKSIGFVFPWGILEMRGNKHLCSVFVSIQIVILNGQIFKLNKMSFIYAFTAVTIEVNFVYWQVC